MQSKTNMDPKKLFMYVVGGLIFALVITIAILGALLANKGAQAPAKSAPPSLTGGANDPNSISIGCSTTNWTNPAVDPATGVPIDQGYVMSVTYDYQDASGRVVTGQVAPAMAFPAALNTTSPTQVINYPVSRLALPPGASLIATYASVAFYNTFPVTSNFAKFTNNYKGTRHTFANRGLGAANEDQGGLAAL